MRRHHHDTGSLRARVNYLTWRERRRISRDAAGSLKLSGLDPSSGRTEPVRAEPRHSEAIDAMLPG